MWTHLVLAALAAAAPSHAYDLPPGGADPTLAPPALDLVAIATRAAATSPDGRAALADTAAAAARTRGIDRKFWPRIVTSARYTRLSPSDPTSIDGLPIPVEIPGPLEDQLAVGVQVALPLSDWLARWDAAKAAGREAEAAERALVEVARQKAAADAVALYWQVQRARLGQDAAQAGLTDAEAHLRVAELLARASAGSIADVRLAEAGVAQARLEVERLAHAERLALRALATALHLDDGALGVARVDATASPWPAPEGDEATLVREAAERRPEARAIAAGESALHHEGRLADAGRWPRLDLVANAQVASPSPRGLGNDASAVALWDASLVASWSVNGLWEADASDDELAARGQRFEADRQRLDDGIALEVAAALRDLADADSAASASEVMLVAAEEGHRVRARAYEAGKASSVELSDAERELTRARLGVVDARIGRRLAEAQLRHALGLPLAAATSM